MKNPYLYNQLIAHPEVFKLLLELELASSDNIQHLIEAPETTTVIKILIGLGLDAAIKDCNQRGSTEKLKLAQFFKDQLKTETGL
ncbi:pentapeptide repeat-containing protein, partial [Piscirickettsia salmonis]